MGRSWDRPPAGIRSAKIQDEGVDFFASEPENWLFRVVPIGLHGAARIIGLQHCAQTVRHEWRTIELLTVYP